MCQEFQLHLLYFTNKFYLNDNLSGLNRGAREGSRARVHSCTMKHSHYGVCFMNVWAVTKTSACFIIL